MAKKLHRTPDEFDGNAIGLTEAFSPVSDESYTEAFRPVDGSFDEPAPDEASDFAEEALVAEEESFGSEAVASEEAELPASMAVHITETPGAKPAAKKGGGRHARHAAPYDGAKKGKKAKKGKDMPEYMRKSRRMRRILIVVILLLIVLLGAMSYFGIQMYKESGHTAVQQAKTAEQQVTEIQPDEAKDASTETVKTTTVPDLVSLLGLTQDEAVEKLQHGAQVSSTREVKEKGNPIRQESRVALTTEPADSRTGTPTVYLGLNKKGKIIQAGYSASTASLGYGALSFKNAIEDQNIIEKTLAEAGLSLPEGAVTLPEDSDEYTTYDSDGRTVAKEYCSFSGEATMDDATYSWSAVLSYDYAMANASSNLADTVRTIFIYVNS
ncbi:MAG: histone-lysine N-methyltransferase [Adlercreutzia sp.]|nr:histone-lysine N-methyltransferase [Adlercreutzia sp.]